MSLLLTVLIMIILCSALMFITIRLIDKENSVNIHLSNADVSINEAKKHIKLVNPPDKVEL